MSFNPIDKTEQYKTLNYRCPLNSVRQNEMGNGWFRFDAVIDGVEYRVVGHRNWIGQCSYLVIDKSIPPSVPYE